MDYNNGQNMNYNNGQPQKFVDATVYPAQDGQYARAEIRCPGKEITCMILGIFSIFYGVFSVLFCWFYIYAIIFGLFGIGCGIPSIILRKKAVQQATVTTKKSKVGKNLAVAGIICSVVAMVLGIILLVALGFAIGMSPDVESLLGDYLSL